MEETLEEKKRRRLAEYGIATPSAAVPQTPVAAGAPSIDERKRQRLAEYGVPETVTPLSAPAPDDRSFIDKVGDAASGAVDFVTGRDRGGSSDIPELGNINVAGTLKNLKMAAGFVATPDENARMDIVRSAVPGTEFKQDEHGNTIVVLPDGREAFMNKPGFSLQDFNDLASSIVKFLPAARLGGTAANISTRAAITGTASGATSVGEDLLGQAFGSEQEIDEVRAGLTALLGSFSELGGAAVNKLVTRFRSKPSLFQNNTLTAEGRQAVEALGFNADDVTARLAQSVERTARSAVDPRAAKAVAEADSFDFPLTQGQATGNFKQIATEEGLRSSGNKGGDIIRAFDGRQNVRALGVVDDLQNDLVSATGRAPVRSQAEAGGLLREGIERAERSLGQQIDAAYTAASGFEAQLNKDAIKQFSKVAGDFLEQEGRVIDKALTPSTLRVLTDLKNLPKITDAKTGVNLKRIEIVRRRINQWIGAAANPTDRSNSILLKGHLDGFIDDAFDNALFSGDEAALGALKNARQLRREYAMQFGKEGVRGRDAGRQTVAKILEEQPTDEGVINYIFGQSTLFGQKDAAKSAAHLKNLLGESSSEFAALKEAAFMRFTKASISNGQFSPQKFVTAVDKSFDNNPTLLKELFTRQELAELRRFRNVVNRTISPHKATNRSGTAGAIERSVQDGLSRLATIMGFTGDPLTAFAIKSASGKVGSGAGAAREAVRGAPQLAAPRNSAAVAAALATLRPNSSSDQ